MISLSDWNAHSHASRYTASFPSGMLSWLIDWFYADPITTSTGSVPLYPRIERMKLAELHFDLPALGGAIKELEGETRIDSYFQSKTVEDSTRFRQGVGVLVMLIMLDEGWEKAGKKGNLGRRDPNAKKGKQYNTSRSLSKWFSQSERYVL